MFDSIPGESMHYSTLITILSFTAFALGAAIAQTPKKPAGSVEERITVLLGRMTVEEKVAQLQCITKDVEKNDLIGQEGLGGVGPIMRSLTEGEAAAKANRIQKLIRDRSRLKIPAILHDEALHGLMGKGATSFPQAIALASTWDPDLLERVAAAVGRQTRARGIRQVLSPVINIARDARWGRVEETYGEDTYLTSRMGVAFCKGVEAQGVITTPKHYAANVGDGGRDSYPVNFNERLLRSVYFPAFQACIQEGGAQSVMSAYNSLDGLPCSANPWLLTDVLRKEWGFKGFVVSDYGSAAGIMNMHHVAADEKEAATLGIKAGLDVELPDINIYGTPLLQAIKEKKVPEEVLDEAVRRVLRAKFRLGLFEAPFVPEQGAPAVTMEDRALARQAAREGIVLLKNDGSLLPLSGTLRSLAVIGPVADEVRLGGYSGPGNNSVTVLQGLRNRGGTSVTVRSAKGCDLGFGSLPPIPSEFLKPPDAKPGEHGMRGEYFKSADLSGEPVLVRIDPQVHFEWQMGSPAPQLPANRFSVRWTGKLVPKVTGTYRFGASTDDGVRLWIDGRLILDSWFDRGATLDFITMKFEAGQEYDIRMEYYENTGWAYASLVWQQEVGIDPKIQEAVTIAKQSDISIVVVGTLEGEGYDRASLDLPGDQEALIKAVAETGVPTIVVLCTGSAVTMKNWIDRVGAVIDLWYGGDEAGNALADILFGDYNPSGRLPLTFPQSVGQVPLYYNHEPTGRGNDYVEMSGKPLFPFGFGLSYTTFEYAHIRVTPDRIPEGGRTEVTVDVTNTGKRAGDEVVQLYLHDPVASIVRPVKELRGFRRIHLSPGERTTVTFSLGRKEIEFLDQSLRPVVEPGVIEVLVGSSSEDIRAKGVLEIVR